ncbi:MAG: DUF885 domain-containing protein [Acidobacteriales bacterium]|nr:DUF885 domain-containing protein [Terriglobales bacterium]
MRFVKSAIVFVTVFCLLELAAYAQAPAKQEWIERSNRNAKVVLDALARFNPEGAAQIGAEGYDEQIIDLAPGYLDRTRKANEQVLADLQKRLAAEKDPRVQQDLEIMIKSTRDTLHGAELNQKYLLTYFNVPGFVFQGLRSLLDDQMPAARRQAALVRLRKYAGMEPGTKPVTELAMAITREKLSQPGLLGPFKSQLDRDLNNYGFYLDGLGKLFAKFQITGYEEPLAKLKDQFTAYESFVRKEVAPKARTDFKLPAELYAYNLDQYGVDIPSAKLAEMAHKAFTEIQAEMQTIAAKIAKERGWSDTDYRAVLRNLKKEQIVGEAILPHYQERLKQLEEIIQREHLLTLPDRPARIRLASAAESAQQPAPNMRPPRFIGNTGEQGEFVLPLSIPSKDPAQTKQYDDFTFAAISWTLTAHEARPGHEMQFAKMLEAGVSTARTLFAFNSTNVEGWGLYAEYISKPFMPLEGQLGSLQGRLMRAARAFSDPELQSGKLTPDQVKQLLMNDVVLSDAMATQEVERYTFRAPGQANSYFYGYTRLLGLRADVEKAMGKKFNAQKFHDFILAQGLLPPDLLRKAVMENFVTAN